MAYIISNSDGSILLTLADDTIDQSTTSLTLIGKNYTGFGQHYNNNLIKLLTNSANFEDSPPQTPLKGELWYNATQKRLMIYDQGFTPVSGVIISAAEPNEINDGDLWWDSANHQLKVWADDSANLVGPEFSSTIGDNGWKLPDQTILDTNNNSHNVTLLKNYGETIGFISENQFKINSAEPHASLITDTTDIGVKGLNILSDLQVSGKITNRYLVASIDISILTPATADLTTLSPSEITLQNSAIATFLGALYPINTSSNTLMQNPVNADLYETGVFPKSLAKVVCTSSSNSDVIQIRLFEANENGQWYDKFISNSSAITNLVHQLGN